MPYSEKLVDHFENPRNIGSLDERDAHVGTGTIGSPVCGDVMHIYIKVGKVQRFSLYDILHHPIG